MALNIKSAETDRLARELAALTGESITEAVTRALEQRLDQERAMSATWCGSERLKPSDGGDPPAHGQAARCSIGVPMTRSWATTSSAPSTDGGRHLGARLLSCATSPKPTAIRGPADGLGRQVLHLGGHRVRVPHRPVGALRRRDGAGPARPARRLATRDSRRSTTEQSAARLRRLPQVRQGLRPQGAAEPVRLRRLCTRQLARPAAALQGQRLRHTDVRTVLATS